MLLEHTILLDEIIDDHLLLAVKPAGQRNYEEVEGLYDSGHCPNRLAAILSDDIIIRLVRIFAPYAIGSAWKRSLVKADITHFRFHDLRHTWASWHVMHGTSLQELMELGGWKSYEMVLRYAHLAPEHLADAASRIEKPWETVGDCPTISLR